jgi:nucleotide-binding universal stress UspA family protein
MAMTPARWRHGRTFVTTLARRVIAGASGTPGSIRAMRYARDLAADNEASLVVALAWTPPGGEIADRHAPSPVLRDEWRSAAWQRVMHSVLVAWGGLPEDVATSLVVARGPAGQVLVNLASGSSDLLVLGAGHRGPVARIRHGRVARYCLAHAQCPVMAVPPASLERMARRGLAAAFRQHGLSADTVVSETNG